MVNCVSRMFLSREDNALFFILMLQFSSNNGRWGTRGGHCQWRGGGVKPKLNCFTPAKAKVHLFVTRWKSCPSRTRWWPALRRGTSETRENRIHVDIKFNFRLQLVISSLRGDGIDPDELLSRCRQLFSSYFSSKFANDAFFLFSSVSSTLVMFLQCWQRGRSECKSFYNKTITDGGSTAPQNFCYQS